MESPRQQHVTLCLDDVHPCSPLSYESTLCSMTTVDKACFMTTVHKACFTLHNIVQY